jgi:hypothetical protein
MIETSNKIFVGMLVISVIAHAGAIATRIPQLLELEKKHQELKKIKLTYIKAKDVPGPDFKKIVTKDEPLLTDEGQYRRNGDFLTNSAKRIFSSLAQDRSPQQRRKPSL